MSEKNRYAAYPDILQFQVLRHVVVLHHTKQSPYNILCSITQVIQILKASVCFVDTTIQRMSYNTFHK